MVRFQSMSRIRGRVVREARSSAPVIACTVVRVRRRASSSVTARTSARACSANAPG